MAGDAPFIVNDVLSTTAAPFAITTKVKQVKLKNRDAAIVIGAIVASSNVSAAAAKAAVTTGTGTVAGAVASNVDDNMLVAGGEEVTLWRSNASRYVAASIIAASGTPAFRMTGTIWKD
jgi:hypothetical protein